MADLSYRHGVTVVESPDTPSLLRVSNFGITFVNGTAPDADPAAFPLNTPKLITSLAGANALGAAGTLQADVATILNEGGTYVVVNRVDHSDTPSTLQTNLIGDPVARTGIYAALKVKSSLGVSPRVLITAGDTGTYIEDGVLSVALTASGDGYTTPPTVAFSGGSPDENAAATATINAHKVKSIAITGAGENYTVAPTITIAPPPAGGTQATATCTVDNGEIDAVTITNPGSGYVEAPAVTVEGDGDLAILTATLGGPVTGITVTNPGADFGSAPAVTITGDGSGATAVANLGDVANAYISALNTVAHAIAARAYVHGPNTTNDEAVRWRNTINSGRILLIDPLGIKNVGGTPVPVAIAPVFAGVRARVVASAEGVSGSVSNKLIRTLDGVARTVAYPADSNYLNERQVATVINERGGLRTWGSRLAIDDPIWQFDSVRATADMINESLEDLYFKYVDRKFTKYNLKMMVEDGNAALRVFRLNDDILGGKVWLSDLNEPTLNANGKVFLDVEFEPVGLMEQIHVTTHRNIVYYRLLLDSVRGAIDQGPLSIAA